MHSNRDFIVFSTIPFGFEAFALRNKLSHSLVGDLKRAERAAVLFGRRGHDDVHAKVVAPPT